MKTRWRFFYECESLLFEEFYTYGAVISKDDAKDFGLPEKEFEAVIVIEPTKKNDNFKEQIGKISISVPGNVKQTEALAEWLAFTICEQIAFSKGKMKLSGGSISAELLAETKEEEEQIDGKPVTIKINLVQSPPKTAYDDSFLGKLISSPLITQFNEAKNANNPIDNFIGFFKILEDLYGGHPLKATFKKSTELKQIALNHLVKKENNISIPISETQFESLVDALVDTRHECAHLRSSTGFGISYGDSRVQTDVKPLLEPLRIIAYKAVQKHIS